MESSRNSIFFKGRKFNDDLRERGGREKSRKSEMTKVLNLSITLYSKGKDWNKSVLLYAHDCVYAYVCLTYIIVVQGSNCTSWITWINIALCAVSEWSVPWELHICFMMFDTDFPLLLATQAFNHQTSSSLLINCRWQGKKGKKILCLRCSRSENLGTLKLLTLEI